MIPLSAAVFISFNFIKLSGPQSLSFPPSFSAARLIFVDFIRRIYKVLLVALFSFQFLQLKL